MAQFFTRPNFENRQIVQRTTDTISLSGTTAIANPGYLQINQGAAPGLVATSLDFDGTVIWGPISGLSWSISACTSPFYTNNIVACPSSAGTIVIDSGILTLNGALQINTVFSAGTASDRLLVVDSNGFVKIGQTGTSISSLSYSNNNLILTLNDGSVFTATINSMTGLTINGNLNVSGNTSIIGNLNITGNTYVNGIVSATTFYGSGAGLTGIPDYYVTGGTYNSTTGTLTLNRQNGSITVTGFTSGTGGTGFTDNYVTGGSYSYSTGTLTLNRQNGSVSIPGIQFTGNTLATCITDIYVQNLYGCNPITIQSSLKSAAGGSTAAGTLSFALGNNVTAAGNFSVAQGNATSTAGGTYAHAEGFNTLASGQGSHAEGRGSIASGNYSHAQGLFTNATTEGTFASGSGSTASGANSFVHSVGSTVSGNRSVVLGGFGINGTANDFVYVPSLNINTTPTNNNSNTQILSRNSGTGNIEYTDSSLLTFDTYVTGFTYNNANQLKISRNQGQPDLIQYINVFTGITVNGSISATTYLNLPRFVTGATYSASAGTLTLTTNYGTNINLTGFTSTDSFVTGYTFTNGNTLTITQNNGKTVPAVTINNLTLTGLTVNGSISASTYLNLPRFVTGGTYSAGTLTLNTNYGTNINVTGFTSVDTYVTGFTYNNSNRLTLSQNQGQPDLNLYINVMSGLTVAGSISASTYLNLPAFITGYTDSYVTGFTFTNNNTLTISRNQGLGNLPVTINNLTLTGLTVNGAVSASTYLNLPQFVTGGTYSAGTLSLLTNYGNSINLNITGFSTTDTYVTGFTLTNGNTLNITQNNGQTVPSVVLNNLTLTGLTINGAISASTYLNLPAFITGFTDTFVTGFTYNNTNKLTIGRNQGQPDLNVFINIMSGLTINGSISASTYLNLPPFTGNTSASCVTDFYVTNIYGCSPITIKDSIQSDTSTTTGLLSFAFGNGSVANGDYSHAEGIGTNAIGVASHAEGGVTTASGNYSHSEGIGTTAIGDYSHAGGGSTQAIGVASHAEGYYTQAIGEYSHAEGENTYSGAYAYLVSGTSGNNIVLNPSYGDVTADFVSNTIITYVGFGAGSEVLNFSSVSYDNITSATTVTVSNIGLTTPYCILPNPLETGIFAPTNADLRIGDGSHAEGNNTTAIGGGSHAEGDGSQSIGGGSHAEGRLTTSIGNYSHAEGFGSQAIEIGSHAEGYYTQTAGDHSHSQGAFTITVGNYSFASGSGSTAQGDLSFVHSINSIATGVNTVILGGQNITGTTSNMVYVSDLNINSTPTNNNSATQILVRNSSTGDVEYRDASTISGGTGIDTFTTGFTYSNNNLTISRNQGQPALTVTINNFTGLTINGAISATTYLNLPQFVTGGTYSAGTITLNTNYGNNINLNVTGFSTTDTYVTGFTLTNGNTLNITQNNGQPVPSVTINNLTLTGLTINGAISASTYLNLPTFITGYTDSFTTGFTFTNNNTLTISRNQGLGDLPVTINNLTLTGLTVNGNTSIVGGLNVTGNTYVSGAVSATTFYGSGANLTGIPDYYVTGGTFVSNVLTLNRQNGSVTIAGFTDNYVTGGTYNYTTGTLTLNRQNGSVNIGGIQFTGNTLGSCITDIYVQNLYGCSNPITIQSSLKSAAGGSTAAGTLAFAFGNGVSATGDYSMAQGFATSTAGGTYSHAEGIGALASGQGSHAEGKSTIASNQYSHAEGDSTLASGLSSHAEGQSTVASGGYSHAEGVTTLATGNYSHAEGLSTSATTTGAHSQGNKTIASGLYSFASGSGSTASGDASFVHSNDSTVSGDRSVVLGGSNINGTQNDFVYVPSLNIDTTPVNDDTNTKVLVRNTSTGNVETKTFGLDNIVLTIAPPAIPIAGVGPSVDTIKGIPQGQVITGYTTIYVNNVSQAGPSVTTNFGTYNNTTGLFTTNVNATLMLNAWIHLKPDTSTSTAWSLSGTGEFGLGICPNNTTDIYVGDYQVVIPDPDTAQYVYELYGANAPRTNQIDISTSTVIYANSGATFRVKVLNKTDRNYAGSTVVTGDGIRFSITRIM